MDLVTIVDFRDQLGFSKAKTLTEYINRCGYVPVKKRVKLKEYRREVTRNINHYDLKEVIKLIDKNSVHYNRVKDML